MRKLIEISVQPNEVENWAVIEQKTRENLDKTELLQLKSILLRRRSIDARAKNIIFRLQMEVFLAEEPVQEKPILSNYKLVADKPKIIIVGAGPAGYFAGLELIELGFCPIILERGKDVRARRRDLKAIQQQGIVNLHSNYCFGEGGAGTYSDGKLYTRSHKRGSIEKVLKLLVEHGANTNILADAHPHIGSNKLPNLVENLRETIIKFGGKVYFDSFVTDFLIKNQQIFGVNTEDGNTYIGEAVLLATGHSARDIFYLLQQKQVKIEAKPFALGVRIEHQQSFIDEMQYRQSPRNEYLPASSYSLVAQVPEFKQKNSKTVGVFSFCMCPGGLIVPAATAPNELVVNGMSMSRRDSQFANSGFVSSVELEDIQNFAQYGDLMGLEFQKMVEKRFFDAGDGSQKAPAQRLTDFVNGKLSENLLPTSYIQNVYSARLDLLLPDFISHRLKAGLIAFGQQKKGYLTENAQIIGLESRTSSPVRIPRDPKTLMHTEIQGLFPCGEGAGYAGGIVSAAMDGQNVATAISKWLKN
jgi:uncharacterized protein